MAQIANRDVGIVVWHASGEGNLTYQCIQMALCKRVIFPSTRDMISVCIVSVCLSLSVFVCLCEDVFQGLVCLSVCLYVS